MKRKIEERCRECGSTEITHDAIAEWDSEKQAYVLIDTQEGCYCNSDACQGDTCRVAEFDVLTGEALGRAPGVVDYIPKAQADAAWADYHKERKTEREDALLEWIGSGREDWAASQFADGLHGYVQSRTDYLDTFATDEKAVEIDPAALMTLNVASKVCKDTPGSFGNLQDPDEVLTILDGWAEEGDKDETSFWFDPESAEDRMTILAWCEQEGPDFENRISELVCFNLSNQSEASAALDAKHQRDRAS